MTKLYLTVATSLLFVAPTAPLLAAGSPEFSATEVSPYMKVNGAVQHWMPCAPSTIDTVSGRTIGTGTNHVHPCRSVDVENDYRQVQRVR
ncbi:hypothetical protein WDZ92_29340 [Nostoc sp. NIES-2111]